MARMFLHGTQFKQILPSSLPEGKFERIITLQAPDLYPDYYVVPFKKRVVSPYGTSAPDLVFIAKDYQDWYIVEVEMAYHDYSHVETQIRNLANAQYNSVDVINYLCQKCSHLDATKVSSLIQREPVKVLLILNEINEDWASDLKNKFGAITSVFEVFHSNSAGFQVGHLPAAYRISRNYPVYSLAVSTTCSIHPYFTSLGINDNSFLQLRPGDAVELEYDNCVTFWKVFEGPGAELWLIVDGRDGFINERRSYQITKLRDNTLLLNVA